MSNLIEVRTELFWDRVNFLLTEKKETLRELASAIEKPYQTLTGWRVNKRLPDLSAGIDIARHFNTTVEFLCDGRQTTYQDILDRATAGISEEGEVGEMLKKFKEIAPSIDEMLTRFEMWKATNLHGGSTINDIE